MYIDPANKGFLTVFVVFVAATIAFLISTIFISSNKDEVVKQIKLKNSNFHIDIKRVGDEPRYVIDVYSDKETLAQQVNLGNEFGDKNIQVDAITNGYQIHTKNSVGISFIIESDEKNFSSLRVERKIKNKKSVVQDCLPFNNEANWYGGPEQKGQKYPVQHFEFSDYPYVTEEKGDSAAISERYWFSSRKFFILVDYETPLFLDQDSEKICFTAKKELPYYTHNDAFVFNYRIGVATSMKELHLNVINKFLGKPKGMPDERVIRYPIWSTWVEYGKNVNQENVKAYAQKIIDNGFKYSLLDIDDFWEDCYGSLSVNKTKFGNLKSLADDLKRKGFIMGMWTHPFINEDCQPYFKEAVDNNYLVKSYNGSTATSWWNSKLNEAGHVNFANPAARKWYQNRLEAIRKEYGIDTFKFDAGETDWLPVDSDFGVDLDITPSQGAKSYINMAAEFGSQLEVRTGWGTQNLHILVRMIDLDSNWLDFNGLKSLIPTLFQLNLNGYVFVLPDMIGGNQNRDEIVSKELFIRWLQANVFMPSLQFSFAPWHFDEETIEITKKCLDLHDKYTDYILERFKQAIDKGEPVNMPVWWIDEDDIDAQTINDEFLLGDKILVAPIVEEGKTSRRIFIPTGKWKDGNSDKIYEGKTWIENYEAPLNMLPYFIKID